MINSKGVNSKESIKQYKEERERERERSHEREVVVLLLKEHRISVPYSKANQTKARTT